MFLKWLFIKTFFINFTILKFHFVMEHNGYNNGLDPL